MKSEADVIIIGAGIWGLSTAYHLAREQTGRSIVVVERNAAVADETTRQAAGQIGQLRSDPLMASAVGYTLDLLAGFQEAKPASRTAASWGFVGFSRMAGLSKALALGF